MRDAEDPSLVRMGLDSLVAFFDSLDAFPSASRPLRAVGTRGNRILAWTLLIDPDSPHSESPPNPKDA
jgi:hypothetical protein